MDQYYTRATINHKKRLSYFSVVDGKEMMVNINHIEREWREVRKVLACKDKSRFQAELNKEVSA